MEEKKRMRVSIVRSPCHSQWPIRSWHTCFKSSSTCTSTPSFRKSSRQFLTTSSTTHLYTPSCKSRDTIQSYNTSLFHHITYQTIIFNKVISAPLCRRESWETAFFVYQRARGVLSGTFTHHLLQTCLSGGHFWQSSLSLYLLAQRLFYTTKRKTPPPTHRNLEIVSAQLETDPLVY